MQGAREYARLFKTGQYGQLYIVSSSHARGDTFHIYALPKGVEAIPNGSHNPPLNPEAVEVYGIRGGQPGWTEWYGWHYMGRWVADFEELVEARQAELSRKEVRDSGLAAHKAAEEAEKIRKLLATY